MRELLWFHVARRGLLPAFELAPQLLSLAQELDDWTYLAEVYRGLARIHAHLGEFATANIHVTRAIDLYREHTISDSALPSTDEVGHGGLWPCLAVSGQIMWIRGYADQARAYMDEALSLVTLDARPFHLVNMYFMTGVIYRCLNDQPRVTVLAEQMIKLGDKHTLPLALRNGRTFQGWLLAQQGDLVGGIAQIDQAIAYLRDLGHTMFMTYRLALLAELQIQNRQFDAAAAVLEEARSISEQYHEHFWDVEVQRLQGELLRAQGATLDEVERSYLHALETARVQQAKSLELRVVMSLANLWHAQGRTVDAHQLLAETYAWFSEDLDTADLRAARSLLDHLSSPSFERRLTS
jgi:tetratricopeptide (TPR) repeat protein